MFSIEIKDSDGHLGRGIISIGKFTEQFECVLEYWSIKDYQAQWRLATGQITKGAESSALITSITNPLTANFIFWWPIYRIDDVVIFQNQVLFLSDLSGPFSADRFYDSVPAREIVSEDDEPISEWRTNVQALMDFMSK